ncbi:MAG TPA: DUF1761 domain-containing protein [Terracidiphilus sp.]|nr:DUF1761 domain-containing protein [Terracidiphilus sp.]
MSYFHVSLLAVLIATVIQWLLGALWYGYVFKARWAALVGIGEGEKSTSAWFGMVTSFIANLILSFVLGHIVNWANGHSFPDGVWLGALCWLGFMAPPLFTQHIFEKRPVKLFAINAAYWLLAMMVAGGVLANLNVK